MSFKFQFILFNNKFFALALEMCNSWKSYLNVYSTWAEPIKITFLNSIPRKCCSKGNFRDSSIMDEIDTNSITHVFPMLGCVYN